MNRIIYPTSSYPLSGDLQSQPGSTDTAVVRIQGVPVTQVTFEGGEILTYDIESAAWVPQQITGAENLFLATPNGAAGQATLRAITPPDLPIATTTTPGAVYPDNSTITIDTTGKIKAVGSGGLGTEQIGVVTVSPNSSALNSVVVTFPTAFATAVNNVQITVCGIPRAGSPDLAVALVEAVSLTGFTILLQCPVPTGGGGVTFDQAVQVYWRALGN